MAEPRATGEVSDALLEAAGVSRDELDEEQEAQAETQEEVPAAEESEDNSDSQHLEAEAESEETGEEVPTEWMGHDLSHIEDEAARKSVIDILKQGNRDVERRLQEIATWRKEQEAKPRQRQQEPEEETEVSPTDVARELGIDTNHPFYEDLKGFLEPLVGEIAKVRSENQSLRTEVQNQTFEQQYVSTYDSLEKEYGALPYERADVFQLAVDEGIDDPTSLYWRLAGPLQHTAATAFNKKPESPATKDLKRRLTTPKPRSSANGTTQVPAKKGMSLQEALDAAKESTGESVLFIE